MLYSIDTGWFCTRLVRRHLRVVITCSIQCVVRSTACSVRLPLSWSPTNRNAQMQLGLHMCPKPVQHLQLTASTRCALASRASTAASPLSSVYWIPDLNDMHAGHLQKPCRVSSYLSCRAFCKVHCHRCYDWQNSYKLCLVVHGGPKHRVLPCLFCALLAQTNSVLSARLVSLPAHSI